MLTLGGGLYAEGQMSLVGFHFAAVIAQTSVRYGSAGMYSDGFILMFPLWKQPVYAK